MSMTMSETMKRAWYSRDDISEVLRSLGQSPAIMDGSHVVFRSQDSIAQWLVAMCDPSMAKLMGYEGEIFDKYVAATVGVMGGWTCTALLSPGVSFQGSRTVLDGVAMKIGIPDSSVESRVSYAYVVPVTTSMMMTGEEMNTHVALVPKRFIEAWGAIRSISQGYFNELSIRSATIRMWNSSDIAIQRVTLDSIIMEDSVKTAFVNDISSFLQKREWYTTRGLPWTRRYLLNGPPGTGKTSLARWAASNLGLPTFGFDFTDRYSDGRDFSRLISHMSRTGPAIAVFDDLEKVMDGQNQSGVTTHSILTSLSGMSSLDGVIIIATSNSLSAFKGPMRRRFDAVIDVPLPNSTLRNQYLTRILQSEPAISSVGVTAGTMTEGFSFDDLRSAVTFAANSAFGRGENAIQSYDLSYGVRVVSMSKMEQGNV